MICTRTGLSYQYYLVCIMYQSIYYCRYYFLFIDSDGMNLVNYYFLFIYRSLTLLGVCNYYISYDMYQVILLEYLAT